MDPSLIKIAALKRGLTQKQIAGQAGIQLRRWYRILEDLAVPTEEELVRVATVTGLTLERVRTALSEIPEQVGPIGKQRGPSEVDYET